MHFGYFNILAKYRPELSKNFSVALLLTGSHIAIDLKYAVGVSIRLPGNGMKGKLAR